ncbi:kinesin, putative [Coccidioides posadasii C735 delta SOWgp]|uniref:Kinesin, putative n=1 Tax=Coccidioides posadasii (strain C735) TaxID=222929 RepID=C5PC63_COCP7|nr:kinesin, putative [Coccidioides posadasii C735 delta SOWgp]EER25540.1 kinesin, putative [Coccidioides posadasii C735 delta SOWgp]|eukprot:XP_003067685.1 kinesin, putative [Coccidioides posadasii C735 delta SOWgp]
MDGEENACRSSAIPRLTRSQTRGTFKDITTATNNASLSIPPNGVLKRKQADCSSIDATFKKKPVSSSKQKPGHSTSKSVGAPSRSTSTIPSARNPPATSHYATRSVTSSAAVPSARGTTRPKTSFGYASTGRNPYARPVTSMDTHQAKRAGDTSGKLKGANPSPPVPSSTSPMPITPLRGSHDNQLNFTSDWSSSPAARSYRTPTRMPNVDLLCAAVNDLSISSQRPPGAPPSADRPKRPPASRLPCRTSPPKTLPSSTAVSPCPSIASSLRSSRRTPSKVNRYLTRYSHVQGWDQAEREEALEAMCGRLMHQIKDSTSLSTGLQDAMELYKSQIRDLEQQKIQLTEQNVNLRVDIDSAKLRLQNAEEKWKDAVRENEITLDDAGRRHRIEIETVRHEMKTQIDHINQKHQEELFSLQRRLEMQFEEERESSLRELRQLNAESAMERQRGQMDVENKEREIRNFREEIERLRIDLERERMTNDELQRNLVTANSSGVTLESSIRALKARIEFLESGNKEQSDAFARLDQQLSDALAETKATKEKLRKEETLRRRLHNQVQELKGNIRVFCRVRPLLDNEPMDAAARIRFPDSDVDSKEISIQGPEEKSSLGNVTAKNFSFSYDHVFGPSSRNPDVFEEISQLVQSALDGYNVCIFCYGQTGSGKTHTMSSEDGMIPRAVAQIYETAAELEEKGWKYTMEGSFVEVYNENLNDLLGKAEEFDKKKHEIRHDMQKCQTTITNITTVTLDSPATVESMLRQAAANRSVAATKANWRSSRSHSVFILKLTGENSVTGERSEGILNLVDLAGSERLSHSGATGDRLRETQNINRSLSCLGDVISALGQGKEGGHIPYRNSKLTYLLQFSLGGNSKTLMFVMVSPRQEHLSETLTSLRFATKVHNTHIGTAKRQTRIKDS